jgi:hypothetical protein
MPAKRIIVYPAAACRKIADFPVEHGHADGSVLNESAELEFAGTEFFLGALALGDVGCESKDELRPAKGIAENGKLQTGPHQTGVVKEISLIKMEMLHFAGYQALELQLIGYQVVRMGEPVKDAHGLHFFLAAAQHAPVYRIHSHAAIFKVRNSDSNFTAFKDRAEPLFAFPDGASKGAALRNVHKRDHTAKDRSRPNNRMRPILDRETGTVFAPKDFVLNVNIAPSAESLLNFAVFLRQGNSFRRGMVA